MSPKDVQLQHHLALLRLRCQDRVIQSDDFVIAWDCANDKQRRVCHKLLKKLKTKELKEWIAEMLLSYRIVDLRRMASKYSIKNYCNMPKDELLKILLSRGIIHVRP